MYVYNIYIYIYIYTQTYATRPLRRARANPFGSKRVAQQKAVGCPSHVLTPAA